MKSRNAYQVYVTQITTTLFPLSFLLQDDEVFDSFFYCYFALVQLEFFVLVRVTKEARCEILNMSFQICKS